MSKKPPPLDLLDEIDPGPSKAIDATRTSGAATLCFIFGLLSLGFCFLAAIPAFLSGKIALDEIDESSDRLKGRGRVIAGLTLSGLGCLFFVVAVLFDDADSRKAEKRSTCINNLKQIALALRNYHDAHGTFPPAYFVDSHGRPTLSWRVALLPHLEQASLFQKFHLDEPWDSPHNRPLLGYMPFVFECPSAEMPRGRTGYLAVTGPGTAFPGSTPLAIADVTDGPSHTLAVVESTHPTPWTEPTDFAFDPSKPDGALADAAGSKHPTGFNALFLGGSVRSIKGRWIDPAILRALATASGGEIIRADQL